MVVTALVGNTNTDILTVGASGASVVNVNFANYDASNDEIVTLFVVPSGSSAGNSTIYQPPITVPKQDRVSLNAEKLLLSNGDKLVAIAGSAGKITATVVYA